MTLADDAVELAQAGLPVFPCNATKQPLTKRGFYDAATRPREIRALFAHPDATLIGMPTGPRSGIVVIDLDTKNGKDGTVWAQSHHAKLPPTRTHRTPSGGWHLMFNCPNPPPFNSCGHLAPGVDVRGKGGYVCVPPSPGYTVARDDPIAEMPKWLIDACRILRTGASEAVIAATKIRDSLTPVDQRITARLFQAYDAVRHAPEGQRNDTLNRETFMLAGLVKLNLVSSREIHKLMLDAARSAGLPDREAEATIRSAMEAVA